ncbi:hypothetical protein LJ656_07410 [Paraburkholderia sp. MMS20-SJTR3]|uniref:Uncharacterized protein n=1 Tax=Paraburkholderia sejongensis TaxID=2886946 RepID=A0ABS8JRR2_9BURK|nr:hypothetical protein [Paraburkholderia sp. MMS20-SJTR3]MCC8392413.1 hypothetical protein [Paraburkholderia sp. MMS20-SJTR3]
MKTAKRNLRSLVDKWLTSATPVRLTRVGRTGANCTRCIHIEARRADGLVGLFFFRHDDGSWQVFPPGKDRLP